MKSFSFKITLAALLLGFSISPAYAIITPQKYCESLAATSCEVLNIEVGGAVENIPYAIAIIKYCRNRVLSFWPMGVNFLLTTGSYGVTTTGTTYYGSKAGTASTNETGFVWNNSQNATTITGNQPTNTRLCSILP